MVQGVAMTMPSNKWEEAVRPILLEAINDGWFLRSKTDYPNGFSAADVKEIQDKALAALTNAVKELIETAKPERPGVNKGTNDPLENKIEGFALGIDDYQANLLKAIGDTDE